MLQITCPSCGPRDEHEFRCGGQSHIQRPMLDATDALWSDYLYYRENPRGDHAERWLHLYGCGKWFNILRDTMSHEITAVYGMTDARPVTPSQEIGQ